MNGTLSLLSSDANVKDRLGSIAYFIINNKVYQRQVDTDFRKHKFDLVSHIERVWELESVMDPPEKDLRVSLLGVYEISLAGAMHIASFFMSQGEQVRFKCVNLETTVYQRNFLLCMTGKIHYPITK